MQNSSKIGRPRGKPIVIECFGTRMISMAFDEKVDAQA